MGRIAESNKIQAHYYFSDEDHSFDALVRNECERELLHLYVEVAKSLDISIIVESEPPANGGFVEVWKFIGEYSEQITLIVSVITIILSRRPVENKRLSQLQIENLEIENELKRHELKQLKLKAVENGNLDDKLIVQVVDFLFLNYKIVWRRSNFFKRIAEHRRITKFSSQRLLDLQPVGTERVVERDDFANFILSTDELPDKGIENVEIHLISPVLKPGNFLWKGFIDDQIVSFQMQDESFKAMVQNGDLKLNNKVTLFTNITQQRKIEENGLIKVSKTIVTLVVSYSINGQNKLTDQGRIYLASKEP